MFGLVLIDGVVLVVADADLSAEEEIRDEANEMAGLSRAELAGLRP